MKKTLVGLIAMFFILISMAGVSCTKNSNSAKTDPGLRTSCCYAYAEYFSDSLNKSWVFDSTNFAYAFINAGVYHYINYGTTTSYHLVNTGAVLGYQNFKLTARVNSNKMVGLVVDTWPSSPHYIVFYIDTAGNYSLYDIGNGISMPVTIVPPTHTSNALKNGWNVLTLLHVDVDTTWVGYINSMQVFKVPAPQEVSGFCGLIIPPTTVGYADTFVVDGERYRH